MKAIRMHGFGGPEVLRVDEIDRPVPGRDQVLIKVAAAGVAYGDVMKRQGALGTHLALPSAVGMEVAGTIADRGDGVDGLNPGTRVVAWVEHGYADYALARADSVVPVPDEVDLRSAACLPVQGMTAYQVLREAGGLHIGEAVLVHAAAGGVGSLAVQLARLLGARTVVGTASRPEKLAYVRELGADAAVNYTQANWVEQVLEATEGRGVELVLESVGGDVARHSLDCLTPFGRMVSFGAASGSPAEIPTMALMMANKSVVGYSLDGWLSKIDRTAEAMEQLLHFLGTGELRVTIGATFPLDGAAEAHRAIAERRTIGKTLLLPELP